MRLILGPSSASFYTKFHNFLYWKGAWVCEGKCRSHSGDDSVALGNYQFPLSVLTASRWDLDPRNISPGASLR